MTLSHVPKHGHKPVFKILKRLPALKIAGEVVRNFRLKFRYHMATPLAAKRLDRRSNLLRMFKFWESNSGFSTAKSGKNFWTARLWDQNTISPPGAMSETEEEAEYPRLSPSLSFEIEPRTANTYDFLKRFRRLSSQYFERSVTGGIAFKGKAESVWWPPKESKFDVPRSTDRRIVIFSRYATDCEPGYDPHPVAHHAGPDAGQFSSAVKRPRKLPPLHTSNRRAEECDHKRRPLRGMTRSRVNSSILSQGKAPGAPAIRHDHIRNDVEVKSIAGSVVL